jgi:threonine dehydrogenase-like Zn-dependent dehydrogenase
MRAVTFQAPMEVRVDERPDPRLQSRDDAIVSIAASGICGSDLHIYHGRVKMQPGFTIGHEFVGTVIAAGEDVTRVKVGERVLGCYHSACSTCFFCLRGVYHKCDMGLVWIKALTLKSGHANVIGHVDRVLGMLAAGTLDPTPLVTHHLPLDDAAEAYEIYDRREALKIVLAP